MKFKYSKVLIGSSLAAAVFALTHCSPNTPSLSKELLLHDREINSVDHSPGEAPPPMNNDPVNSPEALSTANTSWLDEGSYENRLDKIPPSDRIITLSEENHDDALKLNAFINSGKLTITLPDAAPQQISLILKLGVNTSSHEMQISMLSNTPSGQIPIVLTAQGAQSVVTLDISNIRDELAPSLSKLEALTLTYQTTPASQ